MLGFLIAALLVRYLKKTLRTAETLPYWDKIIDYVFIFSIAMMVAWIAVDVAQPFLKWVAYALLLGIVYVLYTKKEFIAARSYCFAIAPYVIVSIVYDFSELAFPSVFEEWNTYFDAAVLFSFLWLVVMVLMNRRQQEALKKEKLKTAQTEEQNKIMTGLKTELEIQVAERTAEITRQKEELQHALDELRATQSQLIQSEKMASLGELTAGIAHEIQNPLNFVNNFSEVSLELLTEMEQELANGDKDEAIAIANDIKQNLEKINHHGKRADGIVKGMLQHSRISNGQKEPTDINVLADEYLKLAYHGLRAKDKFFNATLKTEYDEKIGTISIIAQDIGRVILNLITNAFFAVSEKKKQQADNYEPTVIIRTKKSGAVVVIEVCDNGNGIPQKVLDKIFQPFFTTKPAGQGTGLGLSLSYEIVKTHGGEIKVETTENKGTCFFIHLPQSSQ